MVLEDGADSARLGGWYGSGSRLVQLDYAAGMVDECHEFVKVVVLVRGKGMRFVVVARRHEEWWHGAVQVRERMVWVFQVREMMV
ncbi:unnamed protein product [Dovyalis caffra]|uniref:Uncharacterized protein n=1 Tax=Dovyalis caffra TaxID=77055 RepID=A0AAV1R156_9ROSI|nr:unnamed protein product [Dovyalis caffra]